MPDDEIIELDESDERDWYNYLAEFEEKIWPIFQHRGYARDTALIVWQLNRLNNNVLALEGNDDATS